MPVYDVEIEHTVHQTYVIGADDATEAEKIGRKRFADNLIDYIEECDPLPEDFDVIDVFEHEQ